MALRVKELCKERGMTIKDLAEKLSLDPSNLSGSLKGNPTLSRLQDVARVLGVEVYDLFEHQDKRTLIGFVKVNDKVFEIKQRDDLVKVLEEYDMKVEI